jgi:hypothetical protein
MISLPKGNALPRALAGVAVTTALAACAALANPPAAGAVEVRVLVKLVQPSENAAAISAEASRQAGVAVSYVAATSASWHALSLHCATASQCEAAIARLRAAGAVYQAVELDGRKAPLAS